VYIAVLFAVFSYAVVLSDETFHSAQMLFIPLLIHIYTSLQLDLNIH
jgi:hypothetical protein